MTRYWKLMFCMLIVFSASAIASAQALGDLARSERTKQKPQAARTYTNEDIPSVYIPKEEPKDSAATETKSDSKDATSKDTPAAGDKKASDAKDATGAAGDKKDADAKDAASDKKVADSGTDKKEADKKDADKKDEETSAEKQQKLNAEWKAKIASQKAKVADLERELNLMQREEKLKLAMYYADAGNRLRDDKKWAEDEKKYQEDLANRQKSLSDAKAAVDSARDAARKAGATSVE